MSGSVRVTVIYSTQLRAALQLASELLNIPTGTRLPGLLERIHHLHPTAMDELVLDEGQLRPSILLFVGDRQYAIDDSVELIDGDEVTIFSAISGG